MDIITRKEAKSQGLKYYFTGKPCKNGHVSKRSITGSCLECRREWISSEQGREYQREYMKEYKHTDQYKEAGRNAMSNHRERRRQYLFDLKKEMSCIYCGESNPLCLDMDHIDPTTKKGTPAKMVTSGVSWELVLEELDKCQPVCRNCHNIKSIIEAGKLKNQDIEEFIPASMLHLIKSQQRYQRRNSAIDH